MNLAWGARVPEWFRQRALTIAIGQGIDPSHLMSCMKFESNFNPEARNPGSSGSGLIQWMTDTAIEMGTTIEKIRAMTAMEQLELVNDYFTMRQEQFGKIRTLSDCYMAILWPKAIGAGEDDIIFPPGSKAYLANRGLDINHDGAVTKREAAQFVAAALEDGMKPGNVWSVADTQPAAPIEERGTELPQGESMPSILDAIGPLASAINPVAGILVNMFTPYLKDKINKEADRHDATKGLGPQLSDLVIQKAQQLTGKQDPLEAVAIVRQDPAKVAQVESAAADMLEKYLAITTPLLDKIDKYESNAAAQTEQSRDGGAARGQKDATDLAPMIFKYIARACAGALTFLGLIMLLQTYYSPQHEPSTAMLTLVGPLLGGLFAALASIVAYRFGEKRTSDAATQTGKIMDNVTRSKAFQMGSA